MGDPLLLCTDGLPKHVPDPGIEALLQAREPARETCRQLDAAATRAGGTDNITVIMARPRYPTRDTVTVEEAAVPSAVAVATPALAEPECPAVPAAWTKDDAAGVLGGGRRRAAATRIRHCPAPAGQIRDALGRDVADPRVAGLELRQVHRGRRHR